MDGDRESVGNKNSTGRKFRWEGAIREQGDGREMMGQGGYGSDDSVDGGEIVGNSLGRAPWGRSETEATIGCTEEKPWEIAWGELRVEGAIRKRRDGGRGGKPWEIAWGELRWEGAIWKRRDGGRGGARGK